MIALIQRVVEARVDVDNETIARIGPGLLALVLNHIEKVMLPCGMAMPVPSFRA